MASEAVRVPAIHDGFPLAAELFLPAGAPRAAVLIGGAMAVRKSYYARFAQAVAQAGGAALTVDYRGIGGSRPEGRLRGLDASFHQWGERDLAGAAAWLQQRFPGVPLAFVGHSAGAQLMGLLEAPIRAALFASAGTAYWRAYHGKARAFMFAFFHLIVPAATRACGHLPMAAFGQGDDVPRGVALEWAKWGRDPLYVVSYAGREKYRKYTRPLRALSIDDDSYAPRAAVEGLLDLYPAARKDLRTLPGPLGHFGFFRKPELWPEHIEWTLQAAQG